MAPPERCSCRSSTSTFLLPHDKGILSRCRRQKERLGRHVATTQPGVAIPDDALGHIFAGFLDLVSVVRCSTTCRHWAGIVASNAAMISRTLKPLGRWLLDLAVGFLYQDKEGHESYFVPTASRRFVIAQVRCLLLSSLMNGLPCAGILDFSHSRAVASRNGRLVLELRHDNGVKLCVYNPTTGYVAVLPELTGDDMPGYYACALLTGDDLDQPPNFFRVLLVYNRPGFTALRCYSTDDGGRWGPQVRMAGDKIPDEELRDLGPAVIIRGVAYWPLLNLGAFGVRVSISSTQEAVSSVAVLHYSEYPESRLLGVSPEGRLSYITMAPCDDIIIMNVDVFPSDSNGDPVAGGLEYWRERDTFFDQLHVTDPGDIKMRCFCENSGVVLFSLGGGSRTPGTYSLNLETKEVHKLVDGDSFSWQSFCGYEIDIAAYLSLLAVPKLGSNSGGGHAPHKGQYWVTRGTR